jgi:hypothetical protein
VTDNATEFLVALKEIDDARDAIRRVSQHCDRTDGSTTCPRPPDQGRTVPRQNCRTGSLHPGILYGVSSVPYPPRLSNAIRDLAVHSASIARRPWVLDWETVADRFVVEITPSETDEHGLVVEWSVASEGVSGSFDADMGRVVEGLAQRVGDLAAELWRAP